MTFSHVDSLKDFQRGTDKIELSAFDIAFSSLSMSTSGGVTTVRYSASGVGDGTGGYWYGVNDLVLKVEGVSGLSATDFLF